MELFKLFGSIFVDSSQADKSIGETEKKAGGLGTKLAGVAKGVGTAALAIGTGVAAAGGAMMGVVNKTAEVADGIDKMSAKIGLSKQGYQEWSYIMGQNGMDVDKLQVGMKTLRTKMDAASEGNKIAAASFKELGVSTTDSNGKMKDQEALMNEVILKLAEMPNGAEKATLATQLFGKAGLEMMPMLNAGAQGIKDLKDRSHELGLVMSDEAVNAGVVFGDTMDDVKDSLGMVVTKVGAEVMPIVQSFLDWVLLNMPSIQAVFSTVFGVVRTVVTTAANVFTTYILPAIQNLIAWVQTNMPAIQTTVSNVFGGIKTIWDTVLKPAFDKIIEIAGNVIRLFTDNWPKIKEKGTEALRGISEFWNTTLKPVFDKIIEIAGNVAKSFVDNWPKIKEKGVEALKGVSDFWTTTVKPAFDKLLEIAGNIAKAFIDNWPKIKETAVGVLNGIKDAIAPVVDYISNFNDKGNLTIPVLSGIVAGFVAWKIALGIQALISGVNAGITAFNTALAALKASTIAQTFAQGGLNAVLMANPIFLVVAAVAALIAIGVLLYRNWDTIKAKAQELWGKITEVFNGIKTAISEKITAAKEKVVEVFNNIRTAISEKIQAAKDKVTEIFNGIKTAISEKVTAAKEKVVEVFNNIKTAISEKVQAAKNKVTEIFNGIKTAISEKITGAKDKVVEVFNNIKTAIGEKIQAAKDKITQVFQDIKDTIQTKINDAKMAISTVFTDIKTSISTKITEAKTSVLGIFDDIKRGISEKIDAAKKAVGDAIDKIKGFFNFKFTWPHIPTPKFGITPPGWKAGDLFRGIVPKIGINWNAAGGIFKKPTLFDTSAGLQGVGEAGPEAILPISKLQQMVDWNTDRDLLMEIRDFLREIARKNSNVYLDGDKLIGGTYDRIDEMTGFKERERMIAYGG